MLRLPEFQDAATQRWSAFCRRGRHMAFLALFLWAALLFCLFRIVPGPPPAAHPRPPEVRYLSDALFQALAGGAADPRILWSPAVFSLPTPAGFSYRLYAERPALQLAEQPAAAIPAYLQLPDRETPPLFQTQPAGRLPPISFSRQQRIFSAASAPDAPHLKFSEGWEAAHFTRLPTNSAAWSPTAWSAAAELRFDADGVPVSVLLDKPSGDPALDRRLTAALYAIRLQAAEASRRGRFFFQHTPAARVNGGRGAP